MQLNVNHSTIPEPNRGEPLHFPPLALAKESNEPRVDPNFTSFGDRLCISDRTDDLELHATSLAAQNAPNGWRLSGDGSAAAGVRCSRGLGARHVVEPFAIIRASAQSSRSSIESSSPNATGSEPFVRSTAGIRAPKDCDPDAFRASSSDPKLGRRA